MMIVGTNEFAKVVQRGIGADTHLAAMASLVTTGEPVTEENYLAALTPKRFDSGTEQRPELEERLEEAAVLANATVERLGRNYTADEYAATFAEVEAETKSRYFGRRRA
jgi:hypothetical protein